MQIKRDLIVGTHLRFQLTFESKDIEAHSLLSDVCSDVANDAEIQARITVALVDIDAVIQRGLLKWKSEHPS